MRRPAARLTLLPHRVPGALAILAIRGEFLDQALAFRPIRQAVEAGPVTVTGMARADLVDAISRPATYAGVRVPPELATKILSDLRYADLVDSFGSGVLPRLSQAMFATWQSHQGDTLTVQDYQATGGVADVVRAGAEGAYARLTSEQQDIARAVFTRLSGISDGRLVCRPARCTDLCDAAAAAPEAVDAVLEAFAAQRLLTLTNDDTVEISHEELLRSWPRLRAWLEPTATDRSLYRALAEDARVWQANQHDPSHLYRGDQLLAVQQAAARWTDDPNHPLPLGTTVTEFLTAGRHADRGVAGGRRRVDG